MSAEPITNDDYCVIKWLNSFISIRSYAVQVAYSFGIAITHWTENHVNYSYPKSKPLNDGEELRNWIEIQKE